MISGSETPMSGSCCSDPSHESAGLTNASLIIARYGTWLASQRTSAVA